MQRPSKPFPNWAPIRRQLAAIMRPDLVEHAPEINQSANLFSRTARGKSRHPRKVRRALSLVHYQRVADARRRWIGSPDSRPNMAAWSADEATHPNGDAWPVRVKNHLFRKMRAG